MKQFLKLAMAILCIGSFVQTTSVFATVTAKCPDNDFLKGLSTNKEVSDSQGVKWSIDHDSNADTVIPVSFSGWETAEGIFQQEDGADSQFYTPFLKCSVGNFHVSGFLPAGPYQGCSLEGNPIEQEKYYPCKDAKSCELVCL